MKVPVSNKRAMEHPAVVAAMESMVKVATNISTEYEELRQAIDGGSESMTHEDAVEAVKFWQAEIEELRLDAERYRWICLEDHKDRQWTDSFDDYKAARDARIDERMEG